MVLLDLWSTLPYNVWKTSLLNLSSLTEYHPNLLVGTNFTKCMHGFTENVEQWRTAKKDIYTGVQFTVIVRSLFVMSWTCFRVVPILTWVFHGLHQMLVSFLGLHQKVFNVIYTHFKKDPSCTRYISM